MGLSKHSKNNPLLKELSDTEKCVAYQMSCNVKIETFIHKMNEDKSGLIDVLNATGSGFYKSKYYYYKLSCCRRKLRFKNKIFNHSLIIFHIH